MIAPRILTLDECCEFIKDGTHSSPVREPTGIPVLSATNVNGGELCFDTDRYTNEKEYAAYKKRLKTEIGDVLLTIVGTIGRTAIVKEDKPFLFQRSVAVLRAKKGLLHNEYLKRVLESRDVIRQLDASTNKSAQAGIYLEKLKAIKIPLPPLETQKHIARVLEQADALRKHAQQMETELNQLAQSLFLEMFGDYFYNQVTFKASARPVSEITKIIDYRGKTPEKVEQGIPLITAKNVKRGYIQEEPREYIPESLYEEWMTRGYPEESDILFTTEAPLGNVAKLGKFDRVVIGQRLLDLRCKKGLVPNYLLFALQNDIVQREIRSRSTGSTVTGIRSKEFEKVLVPVPPLNLQMKFSDMIDSLDAMKAEQKISSAQQEKLFSSLMQRAFKGELTTKAA